MRVDWPAVLPHESPAQALIRLDDHEFAEDQEEEQDRWRDALYNTICRGSPYEEPAVRPSLLAAGASHGEIAHAVLLGEDGDDDEWSFLDAWSCTCAMNDFLADVSHQLV